MTFDDVERIHELMLKEIQNQGGRIDSVIFSPHMANSGSVTRKPAVGMALHARKMFHEIRFCKSFMVGDSYSDMLFGKRTGMKTILIAEDPGLARKFPRLVDFHSTDLVSIARDLQSKNELLTL
jgi:HAD superfamily hydrolase (TIGR01662 family)